jgi:serine/threonine protein kinase
MLLSQCEGVLKLQEIYIDSLFVYIVLDYQREGSILGKIIGDTQFTQSQIRVIMTQLLLTVNFMHKANIVHRDLKLENILINQISENDYDVKIADFGLAARLP